MRATRSFVACAIFLLMTVACEVPSLETSECTAARVGVREFYSFHFGNDMAFSTENLDLRKRFLSDAMLERVSGTPDGIDPFTTGDADFPRAFRVGKCTETDGRQVFDVLIFWRTDEENIQRKITAAMVRADDKWLIDQIDTKPNK